MYKIIFDRKIKVLEIADIIQILKECFGPIVYEYLGAWKFCA